MKLKKLFGVLILAVCLLMYGCGETNEPSDTSDESNAPVETDAPETDAPETDAPETDAPETDAPETDAPKTDAPETDVTAEVEDVGEVCLFENGKGLYTFIRPAVSTAVNEAPTYDTTSAIAGWQAIKDNFGINMKNLTDKVNSPEDIPVDTLEILIGLTNRAESAEIAATIGEYEYRVVYINNRIVIFADKDWMLPYAMDAFVGAIKVDENGRGTVPENLNIVYKWTEDTRPGWLLEGIPSYDDGYVSEALAIETLGFRDNTEESKVLCISQTTAEEFEEYIERLRDAGFTVVKSADWGVLSAYTCEKEDIYLETYYTDGTGEARIVFEKSDSVSLEEFNYTYEAKAGETNDVYMFGIMMDPDGIGTSENGNTRLNCGQMFFIKLSDNSLVVIDGGGAHQMSDSAADEFLRLAREATGIPEGEKIRIACWFITHAHGDHYQGFNRFLTKYNDQFELERILYNIKDGDSAFFKVIETVLTYYPDVIYHKPRTGETIQLANITMDVMYTHEDMLNQLNGEYESSDFNDSSTVLKVNFDGKSFMILGDITEVAARRVLVEYYPAEMLKCDVMQVAHHGLNRMPALYAAIDAKIALYPQSSGGAEKIDGIGMIILNNVRETCDELYFGGDETVGVRVIDGEAEVFCHYPVVGSDYTGWAWY